MQKKRTYTAEQKDMQKNLAERLKKLRTNKGLSHEKLIEEIEHEYETTISKQTLIDYEKGVYDELDKKQNAGLGMNIAFLWTFAKYFNVSTDYLLGLTEDKTQDIKKRAIKKRTGLSVPSIELLERLLHDDEGMIWTINEILGCESFLEFVACFEQFKTTCVLALLAEQRGFRDKARLQLGVLAKRLDELTPEQRKEVEALIAEHGTLEKESNSVVVDFDFDTNNPGKYRKPTISMTPDEAREAALWRVGRVAERLAEEYLESKE